MSGQQSTKDKPAGPTAATSTSDKIKRWFGLDALTISARYRIITSADQRTLSNTVQLQLAAQGRFKFDKEGKYTVRAGLFTGNAINSGWNNTGLGTGDPQSNLYVKQLYFDARPVKALEVLVGGIGIDNGEGSEVTGYDNDAYLMGERVIVRMPKTFYFDEVSASNGFFGDFDRPSVFRRFKRLSRSNYHQFLVRKKINDRISLSADYTFDSGTDTLRQAVRIKIPGSHFLDRVNFENYQRLDPGFGYGFNLYGDKVVRKKLTLGAGFARIDRRMVNGDRYPQGNRLYANAAWKLNREITISSILIQGVGPLPSASSHRTRFELIFSYNILESVRRVNAF